MPRILLLDDEEHVLSAIKRTLRVGFGPQLLVDETVDPEVALERLRRVPFDIVISDYRMPLMTGTEFLLLARSIQPHAVRMILSAFAEIDAVMRAVNDVEVFRYLTKPWIEKDLLAQIGQALDRADQLRHERELADVARQEFGQISAQEAERRRLEALEPGITRVQWGPDGEVLGPS